MQGDAQTLSHEDAKEMRDALVEAPDEGTERTTTPAGASARLERRVEELEIEVSDVTEKEQEVRERLRTIIQKIDALEGMAETE